jgi:curved DNA-binding protein CbpA
VPSAQDDDHYSLLGVDREADTSTIKRAWKRQALRWHPDKAKPANRRRAEERTQRINEAHRVLTDETLRERYNILGPDFEDYGSESEKEDSGADESEVEPDGPTWTINSVLTGLSNGVVSLVHTFSSFVSGKKRNREAGNDVQPQSGGGADGMRRPVKRQRKSSSTSSPIGSSSSSGGGGGGSSSSSSSSTTSTFKPQQSQELAEQCCVTLVPILAQQNSVTHKEIVISVLGKETVSYTLGRGEATGIGDDTVSRKQLRLEMQHTSVAASGLRVRAITGGMNPCFIERSGDSGISSGGISSGGGSSGGSSGGSAASSECSNNSSEAGEGGRASYQTSTNPRALSEPLWTYRAVDGARLTPNAGGSSGGTHGGSGSGVDSVYEDGVQELGKDQCVLLQRGDIIELDGFKRKRGELPQYRYRLDVGVPVLRNAVAVA